MKFDERHLELEEKIYYANQKRDIALHSLQMLKMHKEAREEYKDEFEERYWVNVPIQKNWIKYFLIIIIRHITKTYWSDNTHL